MNIYEDSCNDTDPADQRAMALEEELKRVKYERDILEDELEEERNGHAARLLNAIRRLNQGGHLRPWHVADDGSLKSDRHEIWIGYEGDTIIKDRTDGNVVSIPPEALTCLVILQCARANIGTEWMTGGPSSLRNGRPYEEVPPRDRSNLDDSDSFTFIETGDQLEIHCADSRPGYQAGSGSSAIVDLRLLFIWEIQGGYNAVSERHMGLCPSDQWPSDTVVTSGARQVFVPTSLLLDKVRSIKNRTRDEQ